MTGESQSAFTWENDILHHIIGFFVCPKISLVDGEALRSCSLVNRRWKQIVYSPAIWANIGLDQASRKQQTPTVHLSLQIHELAVDSPEIRKPRSRVGSMIGFLNLGKVGKRPSFNTSEWLVMHRATNQRYIISLPKNEEKTNEMIRELFEVHHMEAEGFLKSTSKHPSPCFLRGVQIRDGRLIRWYDDNSDVPNFQNEANLGPSNTTSDLQHVEMRNNLNLAGSLSHLLRLECAGGPIDISREHIRMDCWANLVDWMTEIVVCKPRTCFT